MNDEIRAVIEQAIEALESINVGYRSRNGIAGEVSFDESKCNAALTALRSLLTPSPLQDDIVRLALQAGFCCDAAFGVFYIDHREGVCTNELRRFADLLVSAMNDPAQSQTQPQTIVTDREPHPNAFMQVPQGTEITAHWPSMVEPQQQNTVTDEWLDTQRADVGTGIHRDLYNRIVRHALHAVSLSGKADNKLNDERPRLTVQITSYPESNGKRNWTAMIARIGSWGGLVGNCGSITIDRGELWNRVAYSAERARFLLGERDTEPHILDYGTDMETPDNWPGETRTKSPRGPVVICNFGLNQESFSGLALENMINSGTKGMFQDAQGTIPVTAVGQPVGLVKSTQKYEPSSKQFEPSKMPIFSYKPKDETE